MINQNKKIKILAIGAHGDDIELGCGGSLAKAVINGHSVKMVVITGTESTDYHNQIIRENHEAKEEIYNAAIELGVDDVEILGFKDKSVPFSADLIEKLDKIISSYCPDLIFTHFVFDTHQDHIRTAHATISASRRQRTILLYEPINPSGQGYIAFRPQAYIDITETVAQKNKSLKKHKSQFTKYTNKWVQAVEARAKFRGYESGSEYAECFEILRMEIDF